jgi:hypothetical protein
MGYLYLYRWQQYSASLHTNNTQNIENGTNITIKNLKRIWEVPLRCQLYPGICLTTEAKARKTLS